ncbi:MAG: SpoIID/LytB domain-containing protein [Brumimicrobium sp.]|nr:SpoIID/LytB domain-containing protein [Brumimicrobium sp.]
MLKVIIPVIFIFVSFAISAQEISIGVFRGYNIERIDFAYKEGSYLIRADTIDFGAILPNEYISLRLCDDQLIELKHGVRLLGRFNRITLIPTGIDHILRLRPRSPVLKERQYRDGFTILPSSVGLTVINEVKYKNYLSGVVESEGGGGKHPEYYKAQAVISRTYAIKHLGKHKKEGFDLCDQVHCQAYHNMLKYTETIEDAVVSTAGIIMVDTVTDRLVDGYFHANCGGQTSRSDYVWKEDIPYLQPFVDTFCIYTRQATWETRIPKVEWRNFLVNNYFYPIEDSLYRSMIYTFDQKDRKAFYLSPHLGIPLRDIRYHFKLKSTFFSCYPDGHDVVLKGRGFGHGIGLCQEGAMNMADYGMDYRQILTFYFEGIRFEENLRHIFFTQVPNSLFGF